MNRKFDDCLHIYGLSVSTNLTVEHVEHEIYRCSFFFFFLHSRHSRVFDKVVLFATTRKLPALTLQLQIIQLKNDSFLSFEQ